MKNFPFFILYLILISISNLNQLQAQNLISPEIEKLANDYVDCKHNQGLVIAIINGDEQWIQGFGKMSDKNPNPPNENTLFEIGSITKVFTTTLMMLESQSGQFNLEDIVQGFLPDGIRMPNYKELTCMEDPIPNNIDHDEFSNRTICRPNPFTPTICISFCDLASHTSGLPNNPKGLYSWNPFLLKKQTKDPFNDYSKEELYANLPTYPLSTEPGLYFRYSNLGIGLLGNVIADIHHQPYEKLLVSKILEPLEMNDTHVMTLTEDFSNLALGHNRRGKPTPNWHFQAMAPAGGLVSSASNMLRFLQANITTSTMAKLDAAFEEVHQSRIDIKPFYKRPSWAGYGWIVSTLNLRNLQLKS